MRILLTEETSDLLRKVASTECISSEYINASLEALEGRLSAIEKQRATQYKSHNLIFENIARELLDVKDRVDVIEKALVDISFMKNKHMVDQDVEIATLADHLDGIICKIHKRLEGVETYQKDLIMYKEANEAAKRIIELQATQNRLLEAQISAYIVVGDAQLDCARERIASLEAQLECKNHGK